MRATNERGRIACEGCGLVLGSRPYHIDHTIPDAMFLDKSRDLTAADGKLLGVECCHKPKTAIDLGALAKAKRLEARRFGIRKPSTFPKPPPGFKYSWKQRRLVRTDTGGASRGKANPTPKESSL